MNNIKIHYFTKQANFGDLLNEDLIKRLFKCNIINANVYTAEAVFIGSVLGDFLDIPSNRKSKLPALNVWGTGFATKINQDKSFIRNLKIHALRGEYSKLFVENLTRTKYKKIPFGDPGLLCSMAFKNLDMTKEYEYGIIPHYIDQDNKNLEKLKLKNSIILDITEKPSDFIPKLVKCKKIISSAMHGLIVADSFCIPNIRMILSDKIYGGDFKFNDYYSAFNINNHNKLDLRSINTDITDIKINYIITPEQVKKIQNNLIKSFPYA